MNNDHGDSFLKDMCWALVFVSLVVTAVAFILPPLNYWYQTWYAHWTYIGH